MKSIRRQLTRELLLATLLLVGLGLFAVYWAVRDESIDHFDRALHAKALAITTLTLRGHNGVRIDFPDRFFRGFDDRRPRDFFELRDDRDRPLARSESMPESARLPWRNGRTDRPAVWNVTLPNGRPGRAMAFEFEPRVSDRRVSNRDDDVRLVVASDRSELDETLWELLAVSAGAGALLLAGTMLVIPRVLRRGLKPLEDLGARVTQIDAGSLATRVAHDPLPAELQPVAHRIDELLSRLDQSFQRERRFSADLAHELRTPIAELRSLAECALRWPESRDPSTDAEVLAVARHMEALVSHILMLARGEQGQLAAKREPVEMQPLLASVWQPFAARAEHRGLKIEISTAPITGIADPALLRSVLVNLCDNAVDHAPNGGELRLNLAPEGEFAVFQISNTTTDLQAADVPRLFERFWRKEESRSGGEHLGLGLCLAETLTRVMGWTLEARLEEPGRITFTLRGPRIA